MAQCARCGKEESLSIEFGPSVQVGETGARITFRAPDHVNGQGVGLCASCKDVIKERLALVLAEATAHARVAEAKCYWAKEKDNFLGQYAPRLHKHTEYAVGLSDVSDRLDTMARRMDAQDRTLAEHCARRTRNAKSKRCK